MVEGEGSVVLSSLSDSYEEEEEEEGVTHGDQVTPRPRLRPFFGSDTLSLISGSHVSHTH